MTFLDKFTQLLTVEDTEKDIELAQNIIRNKSINLHLSEPCIINFFTYRGKFKGKVLLELEGGNQICKEMTQQANNDYLFDVSSCVTSQQKHHVLERHLAEFRLKAITFLCSCVSKKNICSHILAAKLVLLQNLNYNASEFIISLITGTKVEDELADYLKGVPQKFPLVPFTQWVTMSQEQMQSDYFGVQSAPLSSKDLKLFISHMRSNKESVNSIIANTLQETDEDESILGWLQGVYDQNTIDRFKDFYWGNFTNLENIQKFIAKFDRF